jgi:hypothetical protein
MHRTNEYHEAGCRWGGETLATDYSGKADVKYCFLLIANLIIAPPFEACHRQSHRFMLNLA